MTAPPTASRLRRFQPSTLRGRLALLALVITAVLVAVPTVAFNLFLGRQLRHQIDEQVRTQATAIAATAKTDPDGTFSVRRNSKATAVDRTGWIYRGSTNIQRPRASAAVQRAADGLVGTGRQYATAAGTRLYAHPLRRNGEQIGTTVAQVSLETYTFTSRIALSGSVALALLFLACVYLVTRLVVGRALRPVTAMSATAARRSEDGAPERFDSRARPAELAEFGAHLDGLLDRVAGAQRYEKQLTAELSHELRTPLARIFAETEWLTARPRSDAEQHASHEAIAEAAARMRHICETLLAEARSGAFAGPDRCQAREVLDTLAEQARTEHPDAPPITVHGTACTVGAPAPLLERLLTPLLDNARRYATTGVTLDCTDTPDGTEITVTDDGPGVPPTAAARIFEPGYRADPQDGHDGAGLGLPLCRRLARAAGGDVTFDGTGTGARFVLLLPAR